MLDKLLIFLSFNFYQKDEANAINRFLVWYIIKELKKVTDARIYDKLNKREFLMRSEINDEMKKALEMVLPH